MVKKSSKADTSALVYIKDPDYAWVPATMNKEEGGKAYVSVPQYNSEEAITSDGGRGAKKAIEQVVNLKDYPHQVLPLQNADANGNLLEFSDMVQLPYLHEAAILYNLKRRHQQGHPYTRTGDIIIAVNPFQWFTDLYTEEKRMYYSNRVVWQESEKDPREGMDPHVYEVSALVYKGLAFEGTDQSILVSGESGAGKTETVKICMNHMASVQQGPGGTHGEALDPVVQRVVESNPLLEAFGNAKTRRNDNSSRFGKYLCLQFDNSAAGLMSLGDKTESKCKLAGSKCEVYLLEKNRVVGHDSEERTYHIFYQILAAPDAVKTQYWDKLRGTNYDSFASYVGRTDTTKIEGLTDAQHFEQTVKTLELIGVKGDKLRGLVRAICAVMQLGNLGFEPNKGDTDQSAVSTKSELKDLADLMSVSENDLTLAFTERTMKTKTESYKVPLNPEAAKDACDALAKEVYGRVFLWLVEVINSATCAEDNYKNGSMKDFNYGIIGLLDIFGFESFVVNRFEQLCINYANEKLQQKFTEDIFRSVQKEYEAEGIALAEIWYDDNTDVLDLIEGRTGLLALLNEECVRPKGNDQQFVQKALQQNKDSPCMIINKMDRMSFGIHHYAGKVMYDADQFVTRNQDTLPTDLSDLCAKSDNFIMKHGVKDPEPAQSGRGAPKRQKSNLVAPTVWGKYKTQLHSLMSSLRKTNSRYIRCIKPNMAKKPVLLEHLPTVEQLRCAGVVAAVTLSRSAFPNRVDNSSVRFRYASMWDPDAFPTKKDGSMTEEEGMSADVDAMMACALKPKEINEDGRIIKAYVVGKTKCYFRAGALEYLEANRLENGLDEPAAQIQKIARGYLIRKNWDKMTMAARDEERKKKEEEERKAKEAADRKAAEAKRKKAEEDRKLREEAKRKGEEERKKREKKEKAERLKREREEKERLAKEEEEEKDKIKKLKKEIKKMEKQLVEKQEDNEERIREAEDEAEDLEEEQAALQKKYDEILRQTATVDKKDVAANQKRIEESEKIVNYLRKENKKVRDQTDKMKEDLDELKEQNTRLIEANASAGASLDSLEKQKKNLATHNTKLEANMKKYKGQNNQLKADLDNRNAYYKAETKIRGEYEKAMEQIVELLEQRCTDTKLIEDVSAAQLQCEAIAAHKAGVPGLSPSDISDF